VKGPGGSSRCSGTWGDAWRHVGSTLSRGGCGHADSLLDQPPGRLAGAGGGRVPPDRLLLGGYPRLYRAKDRGVRNRSVIDRDSVDDRDRIDEALILDASDHLTVTCDHLGATGVVIQNTGQLAEPVLYLGANDRGDLLRRPGGASTAAAVRSLGGEVEDLDGDWIRHRSLLVRAVPLVRDSAARTPHNRNSGQRRWCSRSRQDKHLRLWERWRREGRHAVPDTWESGRMLKRRWKQSARDNPFTEAAYGDTIYPIGYWVQVTFVSLVDQAFTPVTVAHSHTESPCAARITEKGVLAVSA
jgi:hypothetical protein